MTGWERGCGSCFSDSLPRPMLTDLKLTVSRLYLLYAGSSCVHHVCTMTPSCHALLSTYSSSMAFPNTRSLWTQADGISYLGHCLLTGTSRALNKHNVKSLPDSDIPCLVLILCLTVIPPFQFSTHKLFWKENPVGERAPSHPQSPPRPSGFDATWQERKLP